MTNSAAPMLACVPGRNFYFHMAYTKLPLDYQDLIALLKSRGMTIADEAFVKEQLSVISYFRLAGYWRPMEKDKLCHTFKCGSTFENAVELYYFDKELRALLFTTIQSIEIALRAKVIHQISMLYGSFWFMDSKNFTNQELFIDNLNRLNRELSRSKEDFIQEHYNKYSRNQLPPVWKTLELASFGTLSKTFENFADNKIKKKIAKELGLPQHLYIESWLKSISALRNSIAHHGRVWNKIFPLKPQIPAVLVNPWITNQFFDKGKLYATLCCLTYLEYSIHPNSKFKEALMNLLKAHPIVDTAAMGFPANWKSEPLWR